MQASPPRRLLHDALLEAADDPSVRNKVALVIEGEARSYGEFADAARRVAGAMQEAGVGRGDRVAVYMDNTWPCVVSIYAASIAGAAFLPINPQTKADKLAYVLRDSAAALLATDGHLAPQLQPAFEQLDQPPPVICSGKIPEGISAQAFEAALAHQPARPAATIPLDLAALIYTSGSTGNPKGVMQTHQAMMFSTGSLCQYLRLGSDERIFCALPLAFDYGLYQLLMSVALGATLVLERSFTYPALIFQRMREHQVTVFPGVPTVYALLLASHAREPLSFPSVRTVTNTAAALADEVAIKLQQIFPTALIFKMYGLTECKRVCYLEPELMQQKPGSVGKAIPGTEVFLLDDNDQPVAAGEVGVLHARGPHVMLGYWGREADSAKMLKPGKLPGERILCAQDRFRMDDEGFLYFVGRSDDIIKTRGEKVSPVEVENVLHELAGVREAAVIGVVDETLGEAIRAYLVIDPESGLEARRIRAHCAARLENFMVPRDILLVDHLPRTDTGKVSKKLLREQAGGEAHD